MKPQSLIIALAMLGAATAQAAPLAPPTVAFQLARTSAFSGLALRLDHVDVGLWRGPKAGLQLRLPNLAVPDPWAWVDDIPKFSIGTTKGPVTSDARRQARFTERTRHAQMNFFETVQADRMMIEISGVF